MKSLIFIFTLLFLVSCGGTTGVGTNNVTEVGNPTTTPTTKAIVSALTKITTQANEGVIDSFNASENIPLITLNTSDFSCTFDRTERLLTCECPQGGNFTRTFDTTLNLSIGGLTIDAGHTTTLSACQITTCNETVLLSGSFTGNKSGTISLTNKTSEVTITNQTTSSCEGITASDDNNSKNVGFDFSITTQTLDYEFSGAICIDSSSISFTTYAELLEAVDSQQTCEDFGP